MPFISHIVFKMVKSYLRLTNEGGWGLLDQELGPVLKAMFQSASGVYVFLVNPKPIEHK